MIPTSQVHPDQTATAVRTLAAALSACNKMQVSREMRGVLDRHARDLGVFETARLMPPTSGRR